MNTHLLAYDHWDATSSTCINASTFKLTALMCWYLKFLKGCISLWNLRKGHEFYNTHFENHKLMKVQYTSSYYKASIQTCVLFLLLFLCLILFIYIFHFFFSFCWFFYFLLSYLFLYFYFFIYFIILLLFYIYIYIPLLFYLFSLFLFI